LEKIIITKSAEETIELGKKLGELLEPGDIVSLTGDLGAGKTTLTKGVAIGMGIKEDIHSPTFTLIHEHHGDKTLYHIDLYRLETELDVESLGIEEYIHSDGITLIEWAERMQSLLPKNRLNINITMQNDDSRVFKFSGETIPEKHY
jgi:tRNA threonylcarbamoyladenosine biosynthesis protein TsaE